MLKVYLKNKFDFIVTIKRDYIVLNLRCNLFLHIGIFSYGNGYYRNGGDYNFGVDIMRFA